MTGRACALAPRPPRQDESGVRSGSGGVVSTEPAFRKKKETTSLSAAPPAKRPPVQRQKRATVNGVADLSPPAFAGDGPTRSATQSTGAKERSAMRNVALDLAVR